MPLAPSTHNWHRPSTGEHRHMHLYTAPLVTPLWHKVQRIILVGEQMARSLERGVGATQADTERVVAMDI